MGTVIPFPVERTRGNEPIAHPGWMCLGCPRFEVCSVQCDAFREREREYEAQEEEG